MTADTGQAKREAFLGRHARTRDSAPPNREDSASECLLLGPSLALLLHADVTPPTSFSAE